LRIVGSRFYQIQGRMFHGKSATALRDIPERPLWAEPDESLPKTDPFATRQGDRTASNNYDATSTKIEQRT
jgi:hypothetical protein